MSLLDLLLSEPNGIWGTERLCCPFRYNEELEAGFFVASPAGLVPRKVAVRSVLKEKDCEGREKTSQLEKESLLRAFPSRRERLPDVALFAGQGAFCLYL